MIFGGIHGVGHAAIPGSRRAFLYESSERRPGIYRISPDLRQVTQEIRPFNTCINTSLEAFSSKTLEFIIANESAGSSRSQRLHRRGVDTSALLFQMRAQRIDRSKFHRARRQFSLDRAVGIERVGHAVDHAGLQDRWPPLGGGLRGECSARRSLGRLSRGRAGIGGSGISRAGSRLIGSLDCGAGDGDGGGGGAARSGHTRSKRSLSFCGSTCGAARGSGCAGAARGSSGPPRPAGRPELWARARARWPAASLDAAAARRQRRLVGNLDHRRLDAQWRAARSRAGLDLTRSQSSGPGALARGRRESRLRRADASGGAAAGSGAGWRRHPAPRRVRPQPLRPAPAAPRRTNGRATPACALSASAIRRNWPTTTASAIRMRPLVTAIVPEMISVLPRLKALIGMPNPTVTKPAAATRRPTAIKTILIGYPSPTSTRRQPQLLTNCDRLPGAPQEPASSIAWPNLRLINAVCSDARCDIDSRALGAAAAPAPK